MKTDEDWVKHDEELKELRKQLIKLAEQETRAQGRGYAAGNRKNRDKQKEQERTGTHPIFLDIVEPA